MAVNKRATRHLGYRCIGPTITPRKIETLKKGVKSDTDLAKVRLHYAVLAGKTRLDILYLLHKESELCVCDMADILSTTVSAVSHQLKVLRGADLVQTRKDAQTIYYSLTNTGRKALKNNF